MNSKEDEDKESKYKKHKELSGWLVCRSDIVALENAHHHKYERFRFLTLAKLS